MNVRIKRFESALTALRMESQKKTQKLKSNHTFFLKMKAKMNELRNEQIQNSETHAAQVQSVRTQCEKDFNEKYEQHKQVIQNSEVLPLRQKLEVLSKEHKKALRVNEIQFQNEIKVQTDKIQQMRDESIQLKAQSKQLLHNKSALLKKLHDKVGEYRALSINAHESKKTHSNQMTFLRNENSKLKQKMQSQTSQSQPGGSDHGGSTAAVATKCASVPLPTTARATTNTAAQQTSTNIISAPTRASYKALVLSAQQQIAKLKKQMREHALNEKKLQTENENALRQLRQKYEQEIKEYKQKMEAFKNTTRMMGESQRNVISDKDLTIDNLRKTSQKYNELYDEQSKMNDTLRQQLIQFKQLKNEKQVTAKAELKIEHAQQIQSLQQTLAQNSSKHELQLKQKVETISELKQNLSKSIELLSKFKKEKAQLKAESDKLLIVIQATKAQSQQQKKAATEQLKVLQNEVEQFEEMQAKNAHILDGKTLLEFKQDFEQQLNNANTELASKTKEFALQLQSQLQKSAAESKQSEQRSAETTAAAVAAAAAVDIERQKKAQLHSENERLLIEKQAKQLKVLQNKTERFDAMQATITSTLNGKTLSEFKHDCEREQQLLVAQYQQLHESLQMAKVMKESLESAVVDLGKQQKEEHSLNGAMKIECAELQAKLQSMSNDYNSYKEQLKQTQMLLVAEQEKCEAQSKKMKELTKKLQSLSEQSKNTVIDAEVDYMLQSRLKENIQLKKALVQEKALRGDFEKKLLNLTQKHSSLPLNASKKKKRRPRMKKTFFKAKSVSKQPSKPAKPAKQTTKVIRQTAKQGKQAKQPTRQKLFNQESAIIGRKRSFSKMKAISDPIVVDLTLDTNSNNRNVDTAALVPKPQSKKRKIMQKMQIISDTKNNQNNRRPKTHPNTNADADANNHNNNNKNTNKTINARTTASTSARSVSKSNSKPNSVSSSLSPRKASHKSNSNLKPDAMNALLKKKLESINTHRNSNHNNKSKGSNSIWCAVSCDFREASEKDNIQSNKHSPDMIDDSFPVFELNFFAASKSADDHHLILKPTDVSCLSASGRITGMELNQQTKIVEWVKRPTKRPSNIEIFVCEMVSTPRKSKKTNFQSVNRMLADTKRIAMGAYKQNNIRFCVYFLPTDSGLSRIFDRMYNKNEKTLDNKMWVIINRNTEESVEHATKQKGKKKTNIIAK